MALARLQEAPISSKGEPEWGNGRVVRPGASISYYAKDRSIVTISASPDGIVQKYVEGESNTIVQDVTSLPDAAGYIQVLGTKNPHVEERKMRVIVDFKAESPEPVSEVQRSRDTVDSDSMEFVGQRVNPYSMDHYISTGR